jgi:hypothetical protein
MYIMYDFIVDDRNPGYGDGIGVLDEEAGLWYPMDHYGPSETATVYNLDAVASINNASTIQTQLTDTSIVKLSTGGVGVIVGPHLILTAARSVPFELSDAYPDSYNIPFTAKICTWSGTANTTLATYPIDKAHIPSDYFSGVIDESTAIKYNNDFALLTVEQDLTQYGIVEVGIALNSIVDKAVTSANYLPISNSGLYQRSGAVETVGRYGNNGYYQATDTDITNAPLMQISANVDGLPNGGPVFLGSGSNAVVVGITGAPYTINGNSGSYAVRITPRIYNFIYNNTRLNNIVASYEEE